MESGAVECRRDGRHCGLVRRQRVFAGEIAQFHPQPVSANANGRAIWVLTPTEGNSAAGIVESEETDGGVMIVAEITGLEPNTKHGFHIHQYGDISAKDGKATAGHFNPHGIDHAGPDADHRHVGDFGNLSADADGVARFRRLDAHVKMVGDDSIIERG